MRAIYIYLDADLAEGETLIRLVRWNDTNCKPQWSDEQLLRAASNALKARIMSNEGIYIQELPYGCTVAIVMCPVLTETKPQPKEEPLKKSA